MLFYRVYLRVYLPVALGRNLGVLAHFGAVLGTYANLVFCIQHMPPVAV